MKTEKQRLLSDISKIIRTRELNQFNSLYLSICYDKYIAKEKTNDIYEFKIDTHPLFNVQCLFIKKNEKWIPVNRKKLAGYQIKQRETKLKVRGTC